MYILETIFYFFLAGIGLGLAVTLLCAIDDAIRYYKRLKVKK